jgi:hypothetical protein
MKFNSRKRHIIEVVISKPPTPLPLCWISIYLEGGLVFCFCVLETWKKIYGGIFYDCGPPSPGKIFLDLRLSHVYTLIFGLRFEIFSIIFYYIALVG